MCVVFVLVCMCEGEKKGYGRNVFSLCSQTDTHILGGRDGYNIKKVGKNRIIIAIYQAVDKRVL